MNISLKIKFIHGKPYYPQSQGSVGVFNKYTKCIISAKDHQKEEFDLDEAVSYFCNIKLKKHRTTKHTPLDISAENIENLVQEAIQNREKKKNIEIFLK